jgi:ATP-binding cassette subfamily F protein 3
MRAIADRQLAGIPTHVRILHVEQEVDGDDRSAITWVLECDKERARLLAEEQTLLKDDPQSPRLKLIYDRLQTIDAYTAEARASTILAGLGFSPDMQKAPSKQFSGGWRMRIALGRALFAKPDLLLLDVRY